VFLAFLNKYTLSFPDSVRRAPVSPKQSMKYIPLETDGRMVIDEDCPL